MPRSTMRRHRPAPAIGVSLLLAVLLSACPRECECPEEGMTLRAGDSVVIEPQMAGGSAESAIVDSVVIEPGATARRTVRLYSH